MGGSGFRDDFLLHLDDAGDEIGYDDFSKENNHRPPLAPAATQDQQPETPRAEKPTKDAVDTEKAAAEEPKVVPARRWRELLGLRKQHHASSTSSSTTDTKPLSRLLRRDGYGGSWGCLL